MTEKNEMVETEVCEALQVTPMDLISRAQSSNASIEQMQQLFDLQLRYEANEATKAFNSAMSVFRKECPTIQKTRSGHNTKYAGLAETIDQIKALMARNGLSHRWKTTQADGKVSVDCIVTHSMGHSENSELTAGADKTGSKNDIQALGSSVEYLKRYTLFAVLGLSSREVDDDGDGTECEYIDEEKAANLIEQIDEVGETEDRFCKYFKIASVWQLPAQKFEHAETVLDKKRQKKGSEK